MKKLFAVLLQAFFINSFPTAIEANGHKKVTVVKVHKKHVKHRWYARGITGIGISTTIIIKNKSLNTELKQFIFLSVVLAVTSEMFAGDASSIVKLSETPAAVQKTIHSQIGDGTLGEVDKAPNGGETVYNADLDSIWIWFYKEVAPNPVMESRSLKAAKRPLNLLSAKLLVFWLVVGGIWITTAHWIRVWGTILLPFIGLVVMAIWQTRFSKRHLIWTMLTTHCPQCGAWPMNYKSTSDGHGVLICENCQIEWDLGSSMSTRSNYNSNDLFKNISENIDKQVQSNEPPQMRETFERLKNEGHSTDEARRLISAAVAVEVFYIICDRKPFNSERYTWNLKRLPLMPWDAQGKELYRV